MPNSTNTEESKQEKPAEMSLQDMLAGIIGGFLAPFFFIVIPYWLGNFSTNPFEALFIDPAIFGSGIISAFVFIIVRVLVGAFFGYSAHSILRQKKPRTRIIGAFFGGLLGGTAVLLCVMVLSVQ